MSPLSPADAALRHRMTCAFHGEVTAFCLLQEDVASHRPTGIDAAMLIDNAVWDAANDLGVPPDITLVHLPPRPSELNGVEEIWQSLHDRCPAARPSDATRASVEACRAACKSLSDETGRLRSVAEGQASGAGTHVPPCAPPDRCHRTITDPIAPGSL